MKEIKNVRVKFTSSKDVIENLIKISHVDSEFFIEENNSIDDPYSYNLDLVDVATIVTVITGGLYFAGLAKKIFDAIKDRHNCGITIQTPFAKGEIKFSKELTEEEIQQKLSELVKVI